MMGRIVLSICLCMTLATGSLADQPEIELRRDDESGRLFILIGGQEILVYQYIHWIDLPHYFPMNSPSGKNMLVQQTEPYPHHRAFWFADTVRLKGGREVSTYNALYSGQKIGQNAYGPPFRDHIRHLGFGQCEGEGSRAVIETELLWEMDGNTPVLEEQRHLVIHALGKGEYLLDITFVLTAAFGDVEFVSDDVHYAWPYLRLHSIFSGENGGTITADNGATGQEATNMKVARWIDYSNTVEGIREGVAVFQWPDGQEHRWLTREYGCFGPRRADGQSGKPFTLKKGESIRQRVGIFVHKGNVKTGRVAKRYQQYIKDRWQ
jgi:hypothetical protein